MRHDRAVVLLAGLTLSVLSLMGCAAESEEGPGQGMPYSASACHKCVNSRCDDELERCSADSACAGYLLCLGRCIIGPDGNADPACDAACQSKVSTASHDRVDAVRSCRQQGAGATCLACGTPAPSSGHSFFNQNCAPSTEAAMEPDACKRCQLEKCCETVAICRSDAQYSDFKTCLNTKCPANSADSVYWKCYSGCRNSFHQGQQDYTLLSLCMAGRCAQECALTFRDKDNGCVACRAKVCPDLLLDFGSSEICMDAGICAYECDLADPMCSQRCSTLFDQCLLKAAKLTLCSDSFCPGLCS